MQPSRKIFAVGTLAVFSGLSPIGASETASTDRVSILAIEPSGAVERGVEIDLTVDVEADLQSADEGTAMIGFNTAEPAAFEMVETRSLSRGVQRFTVKVKAVPVDWGPRGKFTVLVNLGPKADGASWKPTAAARQEIEVVP